MLRIVKPMKETCASALSTTGEPSFALNQIVRGIFCGVFVVLDRKFDAHVKQWLYILKEVNPANLSELAPGQIALHEGDIKLYA